MKKSGLWLTLLKIGMWLFLVDAAIFSLVAVGFALNTTIFVARSIRTEGKVTALAEAEDDDGEITYRPIFTFVSRDGTIQTVRSIAGSNPPGFQVGESVPIRYKPADPSVASIDTFWQMWPFPIGFGIAACVTGLIGWFFRWRVQKSLNAPPKLKKIQSLEVI